MTFLLLPLHLYKKHSGFASPAVSALGLDKLGITKPTTIFRNLSYPDLAKHEEANKEVRFSWWM
jgi:hypothetical protein